MTRWFLAGVVIVGTGCGSIENALDLPPLDESDGSDPVEVTSVEPRAEIELLEIKLGLAAECLDRTAGRIASTWARYAERVADDGRPKNKKAPPYLYAIDSELAPCERAVDDAPALPPSHPALEAALREALAAARAFAPLTVQLHEYYAREGWRDDDWAVSIDLAPTIRAAHDDWTRAERALRGLVEAEQDRIEPELLALALERDGKSLEWHARRSFAAAKAFARCAGTEDECDAPLRELEEAASALHETLAADADAARRVFWMTSYRAAFDRFVEQARTFASPPAPKRGKGPSARAPEPVHAAFAELTRELAQLDFAFGA